METNHRGGVTVISTVVHPAADLGIGAVAQSAGVACEGASLVSFLATATDADTLSAASIEFSNDNTNWFSSTVGHAVVTVAQLTGVALNAGGRHAVATPLNTVGGRMVPRYARLNFTVGAAAVTALTIVASVITDIGMNTR